MSMRKTNDGFPVTRRQVLQGAGSLAASSLVHGLASAQEAMAETMVEVPQGMTVGQYLMARLKKLGVTHTFGCPGDYVYDVCDAIEDDPDIQGIWCANELNASFCANGAARARNTIGVAVFTMGAELSALQAMADANAESIPVLHIAAMPSLQEMATGKRGHHMIEGMQDGRYDLWHKMTLPLTANEEAGAIITPENAVEEIERVIALMRYYSKPGILTFPRLVAQMPIVMPKGKISTPLKDPQSDAEALDAAVREIMRRIEGAQRPIWLPGNAVRRFGARAEALEVIEKSKMPFFTAFQDLTVLSQQHPQYGGNYLGRWDGLADFALTDYIEDSDCIVAIGPEDHSFNNGFHTMSDDLADTVNIMPHMTRIGFSVYENVNMKDVLRELAARMTPQRVAPPPKSKTLLSRTPEGNASDTITYDPLFQRLQRFLKNDDILVHDTSVIPLSMSPRCQYPDGLTLEAGLSMGMLGFGTPVSFGNAMASDRRVVGFFGDGAFQYTANELGNIARYGAKPKIFIINNEGYLGERVTCRWPDEKYNDVSAWRLTEYPSALGADGWFTARVETLGELDEAFATASKDDAPCLVDIFVKQQEISEGIQFFFGATGAQWGMPGRTWEQWLTEGRKMKRKS